MVRIEDWHVRAATNDPYKSPEQNGMAISGKVYGHPQFEPGERVVTSRIVKTEGRHVVTESGTTFFLGEIDPAYREHLREVKPDWDPENPVILRPRRASVG